MAYTDGSYRIYIGWVAASAVTTTYEVTAFPKQADQTRDWLSPQQDSSLYDDYAEVITGLGSNSVGYGNASFSWVLGPLTPAMAKYIRDTLFNGNAGGQFTVMTWNRFNEWKVVQCEAKLDIASAAGEKGYRRGFLKYRIDFVVIQDAP